jgi:hypothetical protein
MHILFSFYNTLLKEDTSYLFTLKVCISRYKDRYIYNHTVVVWSYTLYIDIYIFIFRGTVVKGYTTFWTGVSSEIITPPGRSIISHIAKP